MRWMDGTSAVFGSFLPFLHIFCLKRQENLHFAVDFQKTVCYN